MTLDKIKCIIWDLDNCLWDGILQENPDVLLRKYILDILKLSTEVGVVNSICSKNDENDVSKKLKELNIEQYFVFNSINYEPKGPRIKNQILEMNLLADNVLFIDDELSNLKEAEFYNDGLNVFLPSIEAELKTYYEKLYLSGVRNSRLEKYKILESKTKKKMIFKDNIEFLNYSEIQVSIKHGCESEIDRISELCDRTHQLNFTKKKISKIELLKDIKESDDEGYICVKDRFGDYGIVGFYCVKNNSLIHCVFSCRIINMGIEAFIYKYLNYPDLKIIEPVANHDLKEDVSWITLSNFNDNGEQANKLNAKVLFKGSCDFKRMCVFLNERIDLETQYNLDGKAIVYQTGLQAMAMSKMYDINTIEKYASKTPFYSNLYYKTNLFSDHYDTLFLSLISLANLGVYKHKTDDFFLGMGLIEYPMYLPENEPLYNRGGKFANGFDNSKESYEYLRQNYDYINEEYYDKYFLEHLKFVLENIQAKRVYLVLGNEERYHNNKSRSGEFFEKVNRKVINFIKGYKNIDVINLSDFIKGEDDVIDHFNHFSSTVYYELAQRINLLIKEGNHE